MFEWFLYFGVFLILGSLRHLVEFRIYKRKARFRRYREFLTHFGWGVINVFLWNDENSDLRFYTNISYIIIDIFFLVQYRLYHEFYYEFSYIWIVRVVWNMVVIFLLNYLSMGKALITPLNVLLMSVVVPIGLITAFMYRHVKDTFSKIV